MPRNFITEQAIQIGLFGILAGLVVGIDPSYTHILSLQTLLADKADGLIVELIIYGFGPIYDPIAHATYALTSAWPAMVNLSLMLFLLLSFVMYRLMEDLLRTQPEP